MLVVCFWISAGLVVYAQVGYPLLLAVISAFKRRPVGSDRDRPSDVPFVSLIVACYNEEKSIESKIDNALALDYPGERFELIVASDGSDDKTVELAQARAADDLRITVLDLPRAGKVRTQDAAVRAASGKIVAFSDANSAWEPSALERLVAAFDDHTVGYACGEVRFIGTGGTNREGAYWRYEIALRKMESGLGSITAGNGAIYATRRDSYIEVDARMGHDLSLPFNTVKRGRRAVFVPAAQAVEKMVPSIEGEFARKRRMMSHTWLILHRGGLLDPRGYSIFYGVEILSHRFLRYVAPFLHAVMLVTSGALVTESIVYLVAFALQAGILALAALASLTGSRTPVLTIPYYYVGMQAALLVGLWDYLRRGTPATWTPVESVR